MNKAADVSVEVDPKTLSFNVFEKRLVVEKVADTTAEISLEDALKLNPDVVVGNRLKIPAQPANFSYCSTNRPTGIKAIRMERERVFEEFKQREGDVVTGASASKATSSFRSDQEAVVPVREQSPGKINTR